MGILQTNISTTTTLQHSELLLVICYECAVCVIAVLIIQYLPIVDTKSV